MASVENSPIESRPSIRQAIYRATARLRGMALRLGVDVLLIVVGFGLATMVIDARATHDASGDVHACINLYTAQSRILIPGQPPDCTTSELLVAWPGPALGAEVSALDARLGALESESAGQQALIDELTDAVEALETANAMQQTQIEDLETETSDQQTLINTLTGDLTALGEQVPDCLSDAGGTALFSGCNVQIVSGAGQTDAVPNGTGNLIVGYNENDSGFSRSGSHNIVVGRALGYSSYGGLVAGAGNVVSGPFASVTGGRFNIASGEQSVVSAGVENETIGVASSVSGGEDNTATGTNSSVSGGFFNEASAYASSVSGGEENTANSRASSVSGGRNNTASRDYSSVSGGESNVAGGFFSSVSGGESNTASSTWSTVGGGRNRTAPTTGSWVAGGLIEIS